jgi:5-methylcytosine-specific restriction endonuclease McrA
MRGEHPMLRANLFTEKQKKEWRDDHCARCGATEDLQLDHVIPRFLDGKPSRENAQTLCRRCNREKYWFEDRPRYLSILTSSVR